MEARILAALGAKSPQTTRQLAARIGAPTESVFRACKTLEAKGRITSRLLTSSRANLFFFPMTREVVTSDNYDSIRALDDLLRTTIQGHVLPQDRKALASELKRVFKELYARGALAPHLAAIEDFESELLDAVKVAIKRGDVSRVLGMRPMYPNQRLWEL